MKIFARLFLAVQLILLSSTVLLNAQNSELVIEIAGNGKAISPDLFGIFFEDLNYAADGGLYAELVQNRSFEYSRGDNQNWNSLSYWHLLQSEPAGITLSIASDKPLHINNPHYVVLQINNPGPRNGLLNEGFDGLSITKGAKYDFSCFAQVLTGMPGIMTVRLESKDGQLLGQSQISGVSGPWSKYTAIIEAQATDSQAQLVLLISGSGSIGLDMISLFPQETFRNRTNGLRRDLAEAIAQLKPKFVRFPGGCLAHGDGLENMYRWKDTIGPIEQRKAQRNIWRYHQTVGLGYYEYFQFCEDIGAEPLPVVPAGVCCQNSGNYLGLVPKGQQGLPLAEMDEYIQEVLDLIEYANGPADSYWGSLRAKAGHPEPFNLKYLGVGNEDQITEVFKERYKLIHDAIRSKYPEIIVIGTTGPGTDGPDYDEGWKFAREQKLQMVDEHGYKSPEWFWDNLRRFDNYPREGTLVYLGEYAAHERNRANTLRSALAEAAYMMGLERNGDLVVLSSYAPLLAKQGHTQWRPDMIYFDNTNITLSANYYAQQLFSCNSGDIYLPATISYNDIAGKLDRETAVSVVKDSESGDIIIKLVSKSESAVKARIDLEKSNLSATEAKVSVLTGAVMAENRFGQQEMVRPVNTIMAISSCFDYEIHPCSLSVIRIAGGNNAASQSLLPASCPSEKDMSAYLLVYFKDDTHSLYMALSSDGYSFTDVNNAQPVMAGSDLALQKGIRDPHISRGPDGSFYLAMTDLHIFGREAGFRNSQWERDGKEYDWGNNRGFVLGRSTDLINWSFSNLRVDQAFPGYQEIGCAWAPETIYDHQAGKMMLYYTMRFKNGKNRLYYTYMNDKFTKMETEPQLLFEYPADVSYIDADITLVDDNFHMYYVPHDGGAGIKHAVSKQINSGYVYEPEWCDPEPQACEAPNMWKRIGSDKWVLMYDIYGIKPHNFGFSETSDFKNYTNLGHFNQGVMKATNFSSPKHGSVIHLTKKEAEKLAKHWGLELF